MRILKRRAIVVALGLTVAAGVASIAVIAAAADTPSSAPGAESGDTESAIMSADPASRISTVMDEVNFLFELPGYSVSVADDSTSTLTVYWKGEPPAAVLDEARSVAEEHDVELVVAAARYGEHELDQAASEVLQTAHREGIPVMRAGFARDGSGLIVTASSQVSPVAQQTLRQVTDVAIVRFETSTEQPINFGGM